LYKLQCTNVLNPMKAYWGNRGLTPFIFNFGARWSWVVNISHRPLTLGKNPSSLWVGVCAVPKTHLHVVREQKDLFSLPGFKPWSSRSKSSLCAEYDIPASRSNTQYCNYMCYITCERTAGTVTSAVLIVFSVCGTYTKTRKGFFFPIRCNFDTRAF